MNILITSVSRKVALLRAFQKALALEGGGHVIGADADAYAGALYFADTGFVVPRNDDHRFWDVMEEICLKHHVDLVVPTRDEELPALSEAIDFFDSMGVKVSVAPKEVITTCWNKEMFAEFCTRNGFCIPTTYTRDELSRLPRSNGPLFVKEKKGKGSNRTAVVRDRQELEYVLRWFDAPIVQEYVDAPEYTVDLFSDFSGNVISVVPRERLRTFGGESFVGRTSKNWMVIDQSIRLARKLGLVAHNTIQCFVKDGEVVFVEVNPRYGGGANLGFAAGALTPRYLIRIIQNKPVEPSIGEFDDGLVMMRYTEDLFMKELPSGRVTELR